MIGRTRLLAALALTVALAAGCSGGDDNPSDAAPLAEPSPTDSPSAPAAGESISSPYCDAVLAHRELVAGIGRDGSLTDARLRETREAVAEIRADAPVKIASQWKQLQASLQALQRGLSKAGLAPEDLATLSVDDLTAQQRAALRRTVRTQEKLPAARLKVHKQLLRSCRIDLGAS